MLYFTTKFYAQQHPYFQRWFQHSISVLSLCPVPKHPKDISQPFLSVDKLLFPLHKWIIAFFFPWDLTRGIAWWIRSLITRASQTKNSTCAFAHPLPTSCNKNYSANLAYSYIAICFNQPIVNNKSIKMCNKAPSAFFYLLSEDRLLSSCEVAAAERVWQPGKFPASGAGLGRCQLTQHLSEEG